MRRYLETESWLVQNLHFVSSSETELEEVENMWTVSVSCKFHTTSLLLKLNSKRLRKCGDFHEPIT